MEEKLIDNFVNNLLQDRDLRGYSPKWANWMSMLTLTSCKYCVEHHGTIVEISIMDDSENVNAHERCKCIYVQMRTMVVGKATDMGYYGADAQLFYLNKLPEYYVSKTQAARFGWVNWKGNLHTVLPSKMIGGDVYKNKSKKLPVAEGRIWYEADINYTSGYRNKERILYSSDGLIFVTYDHYQTFYHITR